MPQATLSFGELFDADFLSALQRLSLRAKRVAGGGRHAERLSRDRGGGVEFKDYRPYTPGDDLRAVDWNIYRRLGKLSLRLFEEQQDLPLYLLPDVSESLFLESPPRVIAGLRATLALAAVGLEGHDSVGLFPFARELQVVFKSLSGRASVLTAAQRLSALTESSRGQRTDLVAAIRQLSRMKLRPGLLVIASDFFDPQGVDAIEQALRAVRHRLLLIQLTRASDAQPELRGDVRLRDCESGEAVNLTLTPDVLERYRAVHRAFTDSLGALARRRGGRLLQLDVERDLLEQLAPLFEIGAALA